MNGEYQIFKHLVNDPGPSILSNEDFLKQYKEELEDFFTFLRSFLRLRRGELHSLVTSVRTPFVLNFADVCGLRYEFDGNSTVFMK